MKLIMSKQIVLPILTNIVQATAQNSSKPITEAILFHVRNNILSITGTDITVMLSKQMPVECSEGEFIVNARKLLSVIKSLPEDEFTIEKSSVIKITSGKSKFELSLYGDSQDYPDFPATEYQTQFTTNSVAMFNRIVNAVTFTSDDNLRAVLTAVYLESSRDGMNIVATDSVRLIKYKTDIMIENISVMIPKRAVEILKNLPTESVSIGITEGLIKFETGDYTMISRLINGKYPSYSAIIPSNNEIVAVCNKDMLMGALSRMSLVANPITKLIKMVFSKDSLQVSAQDSNSSSGGSEFMPCEFNGAETVIGFNYTKLGSALKLISGENIRFELCSAKKPAIIKDPSDDALLMLIMPSSVE